jgi:hypothetical protein
MYLIACFFMGVGNFAMHKAVVESGHPFVEDTKRYFGRHFGRSGSYILEFALLTGAMLMAYGGSGWFAAIYLGYTLSNALSAWLLLSGKI